MRFAFKRPVFTGELVRCVVTITAVEPGDNRLAVSVEAVCRNEAGAEVMTATGRGIVPTLAGSEGTS
jgi:acyl dehydratase